MRKLFLLVVLLPLLGMGLFAVDSILLRLGNESFGPIETTWLLGALAIAAASILISLLAARTTAASLQRIRTTIETITTEPRAPHDTLDGHDDDETGRLAIAVNGLAEYLDGLDRRLGASAAELQDSARLITDGGAQWSQRSDAQLSRLEQTAAGMARMAAVIRENAAHVGAADRIATEAMSQAKAGGDVLARAIRAMSEIDAASGQIADIVRVIDEIAFQTNLLALNAAVEAARAGESGRGFAIVAGEVRSLSQRSAGAAREIRALIGDTTAKIEQGTALVNESGEVLHGIITDVKQMGDIVGDITATTREQSAGIEQACRMLRQIGTMGRENNALIEQIALVGRSMHEHADVLDDLVRHFEKIPGLYAPRIPQVMPEFEAPPEAAPIAPMTKPESVGYSAGHKREPFIERRKADRPWSDSPAREGRE